MENTRNALHNRGGDFKNKAEEAVEKATDKAKEAGTGLANRAKEAASNVAKTTEEFASGVGRKAEEATSALGSGMKSLASTVREKGPHGGMLGPASEKVAEGLESGGRYLEESGIGGIAKDVASVVRNNPIPALLLGIGLGYLLARATRS